MNNRAWIGFWTLLLHEINRFCRVWRETLLPPLITMGLYFAIFGKLIGSQISSIHGFAYMVYITPGLIMMPVITSSYLNTGFSLYLLRFQKSIEEILVSPLSNGLILLAFTLGGVARGLMIGCLVMTLSLFFTHIHIFNPILMLFTLILTSVLFSLAGFLNGLFARTFDDISIMPTFILTPLTYLGGVFYSVNMLSHIWQKISLFNPVLYLINIFRYSLLGVTDIAVIYALWMIIVFIMILAIINYYLLSKGVGIRT